MQRARDKDFLTVLSPFSASYLSQYLVLYLFQLVRDGKLFFQKVLKKPLSATSYAIAQCPEEKAVSSCLEVVVLSVSSSHFDIYYLYPSRGR